MFRDFFERLRRKLVPTRNEMIDDRSNTETEWSSNAVENNAAFVNSPLEFFISLGRKTVTG